MLARESQSYQIRYWDTFLYNEPGEGVDDPVAGEPGVVDREAAVFSVTSRQQTWTVDFWIVGTINEAWNHKNTKQKLF